MKLIPARCPSCGADIEVNKENETTKCKYCDTRIIIDDAIAKYKVELSGKVTVENLPTVINLIKIGTRHLDKNEYLKAQEKFEKALELDADNSELIIKDSLARVASQQIHETSLNKLLASIKEAKEFCLEKELEELVMYCIEHLDHKRIQMIPVFQNIPNQEVFFNLKQKFITYISFYERIYRNYLNEKENKKQMIKKIFACIQCYKDNNKYATYNIQTGNPVTLTYRIPKDMMEYLDKKEEQYKDELAKYDEDFAKKYNEEKTEKEKIRLEKAEQLRKQKEKKERIFGTNPMTIPDIYVSGFFLLIIFAQLLNCERATNALAFLIVLIITAIVSTPLVLLRQIKPLRSIPQSIVITLTIIRYFIVIILLCSLGTLLPTETEQEETPTFIGKSFISADSTQKIIISKKVIGMESISTTGESISKLKYDYTYEKENDGNYILTIGYGTEMTADDTRYRYSEETESLCILNYSKKCINTYSVIPELETAEIEDTTDSN